MNFSLLPNDYKFFDMFDNLAAHCVNASNEFHGNINKSVFHDEDVKKIKETERSIDNIVFEFVEKIK